MNLWGFDRNTSVGPEKGAYFHPFFQRDEALVVEKLRRVRAIPKVPAKERRRRQALVSRQSPRFGETAIPTHPNQLHPQPQLQNQSPPQEVKTKVRDSIESPLDSPQPAPEPPTRLSLDDGISTLLGVAETLNALRKQPPRVVTSPDIRVVDSSHGNRHHSD